MSLKRIISLVSLLLCLISTQANISTQAGDDDNKRSLQSLSFNENLDINGYLHDETGADEKDKFSHDFSSLKKKFKKHFKKSKKPKKKTDLCKNVECGECEKCNKSTGKCKRTKDCGGSQGPSPPQVDLCKDKICGACGECDKSTGSCNPTQRCSNDLCMGKSCGPCGECDESTGSCNPIQRCSNDLCEEKICEECEECDGSTGSCKPKEKCEEEEACNGKSCGATCKTTHGTELQCTPNHGNSRLVCSNRDPAKFCP